MELAAGGGLTFQVKRGSELQPFGGATALAFSLRAGQPPPAPAVREVRRACGWLSAIAPLARMATRCTLPSGGRLCTRPSRGGPWDTDEPCLMIHHTHRSPISRSS